MRVIRKLLRDPQGIIGLVIVLGLLGVAILGSTLAPYDPVALNLRQRLQPPSGAHLFGTDGVGRDLLSRVLVGTRVSMQAGLLVVTIGAVIGVPLGLIAGYRGRATDKTIMRITDMFVGFPPLVMAVAVAAALGSGLFNGVVAVSIIWWPGYVRLVRAQVLSIKSMQYLEAARALGISTPRVLVRHVLPNVIDPIIVKYTVDVGYAILFVASLGFLGLGAQPPTPEWGAMIAESRAYTLSFPWYPVFPGIALFLAVVGFNLLGDAAARIASVEAERSW